MSLDDLYYVRLEPIADFLQEEIVTESITEDTLCEIS